MNSSSKILLSAWRKWICQDFFNETRVRNGCRFICLEPAAVVHPHEFHFHTGIGDRTLWLMTRIERADRTKWSPKGKMRLTKMFLIASELRKQWRLRVSMREIGGRKQQGVPNVALGWERFASNSLRKASSVSFTRRAATGVPQCACVLFISSRLEKSHTFGSEPVTCIRRACPFMWQTTRWSMSPHCHSTALKSAAQLFWASSRLCRSLDECHFDSGSNWIRWRCSH